LKFSVHIRWSYSVFQGRKVTKKHYFYPLVCAHYLNEIPVKNKFVFLALFTAYLMLPGFSSCKKSNPDPLYPQLIGTYQGTTSQNDTIRMEVENIKGILYITEIKLNYKYSGGGTGSVYKKDSDGLTALIVAYFNLLVGSYPQNSIIDGTFNLNSLTVNGSFKIYPSSNPSNPSSGSYTALKIN